MSEPKLIVALVSASVLREAELPGFETVSDFASENYNLAIGSIAAWANSQPDLADNLELHLFDFPISWDNKTLGDLELSAVLSIKPDLIGMSCYCWSIDTLIDLATKARSLCTSAHIVAGGPSVGSLGKQLLERHPALDSVVEGEGESAFASILRSRLRNEDPVSATWFRNRNGQIQSGFSAPEDETVDLEKISSPYRMGILRPKSRSLLLETSRGCKYRCRFCSWMGGGRRLRYVPIESIKEDLKWAIDNGYQQIKIADTAINFDTPRLAELASVIRSVDSEKKLRFTYFLKPELFDDSQASLLRGIPADEIIIGVESINDPARLSAAKGPFNFDQFHQMMTLVKPLGPVTASFIMGLPGDTPEGLARTLDFIVDYDNQHPNSLHMIILFWLALLPGSRLHAQMEDSRVRCMGSGTPYLLESDYQSPDSLLQMARISVTKHYAHPKMRVEYFHKEYLAQDAPAQDRHVVIPRRNQDERELLLVCGAVDNAPFLTAQTPPYSLEAAWLKALLEQDSCSRKRYRIELTNPIDLNTISEHHKAIVFSSGRNGEQLAQPGFGEQRVCDPQIFGDLAALSQLFEELGCQLPSDLSCLDFIPSPFQWGFIQRPSRSIVMRLGLGEQSGHYKSHFSASRIEADIRWAIEQHHDLIVWADPALPSDLQLLKDFVSAIRRADPEKRIRHTGQLPPVNNLVAYRQVLGDLFIENAWFDPVVTALRTDSTKAKLLSLDVGDGETIRLTLELETKSVVYLFLNRAGKIALKVPEGSPRPNDTTLAAVLRQIKNLAS